MTRFAESVVEAAALQWLRSLDWRPFTAPKSLPASWPPSPQTTVTSYSKRGWGMPSLSSTPRLARACHDADYYRHYRKHLPAPAVRQGGSLRPVPGLPICRSSTLAWRLHPNEAARSR